MQKSVKVCDNPGCGKTEEKGNHWYRIGCNSGFVIITRCEPFDVVIKETVAVIGWKDACGQSCAVQMLSKWMNPDETNAH